MDAVGEPSSTFTKEQVADLREAFSLFDKNLTGNIAANDIGMLLRTVGQNYTDEELHNMITEANEDNGLISFQHFLEIMEARFRPHDLEKEILDAFSVFDKGGNGSISYQELKQLMAKLGERLTDDELDEMMREADLSGNGRISFQEFRLLLLNN